MGDDYSVDVVIPAYNAELFIVDAINSVLHQTLAPKEIIVVNDGSSDNTAQLLSDFGDKITVVSHPENKGLPAARNSGIKIGSSPLIAFLDADDTWLPHKLECQLAAFTRDPDTGLCYSNLQDCDEKMRPVGHPRRYKERCAENVFDELIKDPFPMPPSTVIVKRDAIEKCGLFDESMLRIEDYECWLRVSMLYPISCVTDSLCLRRLHGDAISSTYGPGEKIKWEYEVIERCFDAAEKFNIYIPISKENARIDALRRRLFKHIKWNDNEGVVLYRKMLIDSGCYSSTDKMKAFFLSQKTFLISCLGRIKRKIVNS